MATDYEETLQLAKEAGMFTILGPLSNLLPHELVVLQRFAELVAAKEREACAKVCDAEDQKNTIYRVNMNAAANCATAIRARNNKESKE